MKKNHIMIAALFLGIGLCATAQAGERAGAISISPMVGVYGFDNQQDIEKDAVGGLGIGYNITDHWAAEAMFTYGKFDHEYFTFESCGCAQDDVESYMARGDILYHFQPDQKLVPYLAVGGGIVRVEGDHYEDDTYGIINYGGGLKYYFNDNIALRGDIRHIFGPEDSYNNVAGLVGLTINFGGGKKTPETVPEPPEALTVTEPEPEPVVQIAEVTEAPAEKIEKNVAINLNIQFDRDKSVVKPIYHDRLKEVADFMKKYPETHAVVEGHTCNLATASYNLKLSQRRADSVRKYMVRNFGIKASRIEAHGYGLTQPVADNATEEGRIKNRRVIVIVSDGVESAVPEPKPQGAVENPEKEVNIASSATGNTIRNIRLDRSEAGVEVAIVADSPIGQFTSFRMDSPNRLVIDLPGNWQEPERIVYNMQDKGVRKVRIGYHADKLRIVMDLGTAGNAPADIKANEEKLLVSFG